MKLITEETLKLRLKNAFSEQLGLTIENEIELTETRREFEGEFTFITFPYTGKTQKKPEELGKLLGEYLLKQTGVITAYNVVKGFLNLSVKKDLLRQDFQHALVNEHGKEASENAIPVVIEFSSPNTNKPLHLGHVRNNLLGAAMANILKKAGEKVIRVNLVNDRGVHICKSMLAWQKLGNGETPQSAGMKGDKLVGKYYVLFDKHYKAELEELKSKGLNEKEAEQQSVWMKEVREMLVKWEQNDEAVVNLWKIMNAWVYEGFASTYQLMGIAFEKTYYESETYLSGKQIVEKGRQDGVIAQKEDGSLWLDLTAEGLDEKCMLRSDGTSVYITQDLGTAVARYNEFVFGKMIYVVGNEQDYHFKVLFKALQKLGYDWHDKLYHLSYGMVELPHGKMKSREGTVVDADDLMQEMMDTAASITTELGKTEGMTEKEKLALYKTVGLGALKYFMLKVDPKKKMLFNPEESIDFQGNTGPFIQYTYARINSVLNKASQTPNAVDSDTYDFLPKEKELLLLCLSIHKHISESARTLNPSIVANYCYELAKTYNQFYHDFPILKETQIAAVKFRLQLSQLSARCLATGMNLLGIDMPARM
jgi:arginyl-tRNA synthetase